MVLWQMAPIPPRLQVSICPLEREIPILNYFFPATISNAILDLSHVVNAEKASQGIEKKSNMPIDIINHGPKKIQKTDILIRDDDVWHVAQGCQKRRLSSDI